MLAGYDVIEILHATRDVRVLRCQRQSDGLPVIIKHTQEECDAQQQALRHEYRMLQHLQQTKAQAVPQPVELVRLADAALAIVTRDVRGRTLRALMQHQDFDVGAALRMGIGACNAVMGVHRAQLVHRDINPSNLVVHGDQIQVIDFGIATPLHAGEQAPERLATRKPEGTSGYLAPEQTGLLGAPVDERTDLYCLGATLYELLTGKRPFAHADVDQQLRAIVSTPPAPPQALAPQVPHMLGQVVLRLLEKRPEARYQSAYGLLRDLQACERAWRLGQQVPTFALAEHDTHQRFELPDTLLGRDHELALLAQAHALAAQGRAGVVLVSGPSGVGKSALVHAAQRLIAAGRGLFIAGKHEAQRRHVPFWALRQALATLAEQLLSEAAEPWAPWAQKLRDAVGPAGQALIDLCPNLQHLLGPQPPVPTLAPTANEQRLLYALRRLFDALCATQPLVLFLDDLQWADSATLRVLEALHRGASEVGYGMLLIGAYRIQAPAHPLTRCLERLTSSPTPPTHLHLDPLSENDVAALVATATRHDGAAVGPLARWMRSKTRGNPLFVRECLRDLHARGLLSLAPNHRTWTWDMQRIAATTLSSDVMSLLHRRLSARPPEEQRLLPLAACLGMQFGLQNLAALSRLPQAQVVSILGQAARAGWLLPAPEPAKETQQYAFAHDRMHQAAYASLSPDAAVRAHHRISLRWLGQLQQPASERRLFETLEHLNAARGLMTEPQARAQLAELNLRGGAAARRAAAYDLAETYTDLALQLLPADAWKTQHETVRRTQLQLADCEFLLGKTEAAQTRLEGVRRRSRDGTDLAEVYERKLHCQTVLSDYRGAVRFGALALRALGFPFETRPSAAQVTWARLRLYARLRAAPPEQAALGDPHVLRILRILDAMCLPAYFAAPRLYVYLAFTLGGVAAAHGLSEHSAFAFATLCAASAAQNRPHDALRFAGMAHAFIDREPASLAARRALIAMHVSIDYARMTAPELADSCHAGAIDCLEYGDINMAANTSMVGLDAAALHALPLAQMRLRQYQRLAAIGNREAPIWYRMHVQMHRMLTGQTHSPTTFTDDGFDEAAHLAGFAKGRVGLATHHFLKLVALCAHAEWTLALHHGAEALRHGVLTAHSEQVAFYFGSLYTLALTQHALANGHAPQETGFLRRMRRKQARLARAQPGVATGVSLLSQAERKALAGKHAEAARLYEAALPWLDRAQYTAFVAMATECYARLRAREGRQDLAQPLWRQAIAAHRAWGATHRAGVLMEQLRADQETIRATQRLHHAFTGASTQRMRQ